MGLFGGARSTTRLRIEGMHCGNCKTKVETALRAVPGVTQAQVDLMFHKATVTHDPARASVDALIAAVESSGYKAKPEAS